MPAAEMEHEQAAAGMGAEAADMATSEVEAASAAIGAVAIRQQNMKAATAHASSGIGSSKWEQQPL